MCRIYTVQVPLICPQRGVAGKRTVGTTPAVVASYGGLVLRVLIVSAWVAGCLPSDDSPPATWNYIHAAIVQPSCATAGCHSTLTAIAGLGLSSRDGAYTMLTGHICGEPMLPQDPPRNFITPFSAEYSQLMYQLRGADREGNPYRDVMPPDTRLPELEIELVAEWIDSGAECE